MYRFEFNKKIFSKPSYSKKEEEDPETLIFVNGTDSMDEIKTLGTFFKISLISDSLNLFLNILFNI